jgi:hypothetical protein
MWSFGLDAERLKELVPLREGPASHQLVGKVMAYQGDDG